MDEILAAINRRLAECPPKERPVIGIDGIDASGKTYFAECLATAVSNSGRQCCLIHVDDFHNPKRIRYAGTDEVQKYYHQSFDYETLIRRVLIPIRTAGRLDLTLDLLDLKTDQFCSQKRFVVTEQSIVIIEGVFLLRPELKDFIDIAILLKVSFEESLLRARKRDLHIPPEEIAERYRSKYHAAQRYYFQTVQPEKLAAIIVNNENYKQPVLLLDKT